MTSVPHECCEWHLSDQTIGWRSFRTDHRNEVLCHSTKGVPPCSIIIISNHRPNVWSPSPTSMISLNERNSPQWVVNNNQSISCHFPWQAKHSCSHYYMILAKYQMRITVHEFDVLTSSIWNKEKIHWRLKLHFRSVCNPTIFTSTCIFHGRTCLGYY